MSPARMADIYHDFPINASAERVFDAITSPPLLDSWWTARSAGEPAEGSIYTLWFGPEYDWRALVRTSIPGVEFEWEITDSDSDWRSTRMTFHLKEESGVTRVRFRHTGWPEENEHYRVSCFCWAMYLRLLKRLVEKGEVVPYDERLEV